MEESTSREIAGATEAPAEAEAEAGAAAEAGAVSVGETAKVDEEVRLPKLHESGLPPVLPRLG
jgi:hypothetical protein